MCLLVLQKEGSTLSHKELKNSYKANSDGIGYSFVDNGRLMTKKFRNFKKFVKGYDSDTGKFGSVSPFLLHFRLATHGVNTGVENVHPFKVNDNLVFAHNGIISGVSDSPTYSDTQMFNVEILQKLQNIDKEFLKNIVLVKLISEFVSGSKLAFLDSDGTFSIINETSGHWNDEKTIWFSNHGYQETAIYSYGYSPYGSYISPYTRGGSKSFSANRDTRKKSVVELFNDDYDDLLPACEWCGMESGDLKKCDVTDLYVSDEPVVADLCPECATKKTPEINGGSDEFSLLC